MPEYVFQELQENQRRILEMAVAAYQAYGEARKDSLSFKGGMHWKKIKGRQYLYRYRDRLGHGGSLGPRSPHTEAKFREFERQRQETLARLAVRRRELAESARFCRAALLHRVSDPVVRILRVLAQGDLPGAQIMVIGTQALHAYEFAAEAFIEAPETARFWTGEGQKLTLAGAGPVAPEDLLRLLRRADRSFRLPSASETAAVNKAGLTVRLLRPSAARFQPQDRRLNNSGTLVPAATGDLAALVNSPRFSQVVIGRRGDPVIMVTPDPRAQALHKLWLSQQEGREAADRERDRVQAQALAELVLRYLPQYYFFATELRLFPPEVASRVGGLVEGYESSEDLGVEY